MLAGNRADIAFALNVRNAGGGSTTGQIRRSRWLVRVIVIVAGDAEIVEAVLGKAVKDRGRVVIVVGIGIGQGACTAAQSAILSAGIPGAPVAAGVCADLADTVGNRAAVQEQDSVITVEQPGSGGLIRHSENGRVSSAMRENEVAARSNRTLQVEGLPGGGAAVEENLQLPGSKIHHRIAGVEQFNGFVVAGAFDILADDQRCLCCRCQKAADGGCQQRWFHRHGTVLVSVMLCVLTPQSDRAV